MHWLLFGTVYFVVPLVATSTSAPERAEPAAAAWRLRQIVITTRPVPADRSRTSLLLALEFTVLSLLLLVPTAYLGAPAGCRALQPTIEFLTVLPLVVPPIVLIVGCSSVYNGTRP